MKRLIELCGQAKKKSDDMVALLSDKSKPFFIQNFIVAFVIAFFTTSVLYMDYYDRTRNLSYTNLEFVSSQHIVIFALTFGTLAAILIVLFFVSTPEKVIPITLVLSMGAFCYFLQIAGQKNIWLGIGVAIMIYIACRWLFERFDMPFFKKKIGFNTAKIFIIILFVYFVVYMSLMGICRYYSFTYSSFDFGIFAQMFDYMKETGLPFTTVERNELLSHFAVHFSPFFYILLPGYLVFSTPAYLCVVQTLFVGASVFAVYGIAKHLGFSPLQTVFACALFLLYPAFSYGLYYDFHENKFLTFCILYTVYFMLKRKYVPFYISALLLCTVKEDSAIYLVVIALFMLLHERRIKHGIVTLLMALVYFVFALKMIQVCGAIEENQFGYRYENYSLEGVASIGSILKITIMDFGYTISQIFQQQKMEFVLWMFLPVMFLPFMTKKVSTLVLLAPMLLVNFMTCWIYQYDVEYQYTYGSGALIIVCTLLVLRQLSPKARNMFLLTSVIVSAVLTIPYVNERNAGYISEYIQNDERYKESIEFIDDNLSKESVIGVEGNVMPMLYDYPNLYFDPHDDELASKIEYYVSKSDDGDIMEMVNRGFEWVADNGYIVIYKNPYYQKN